MGITLDLISASLHSIAIKDSVNGYELAISSAGKITSVIEDGGNSITVDGTVAATQSGTWDIGTVGTITNVVHIDDNSSSITVDGTVAATQSGTWDIGTLGTITNVVHIDDNSGSITVDGTVSTTPGGYGSWKVSAASVSNTESELVGTPLSNRVAILIQNKGSQDCYIKEATGVSTSNGIYLPKGSSYEALLDADSNIFAITASGSTDLRIAEYAA